MQDKIDFNLSPEQLSDLLVTAFEGGSNYWIGKVKLVQGVSHMVAPWYSDKDLLAGDFLIYIWTDDGDKYELTPDLISRNKTLQRVAFDLENNMMDAETADVWLQNVLFNEIIYG